ncbi:hypothetical protein ACNKHP_01865 [Shigella boydii]
MIGQALLLGYYTGFLLHRRHLQSVTIINSNIGAILTSCISSYQQGKI